MDPKQLLSSSTILTPGAHSDERAPGNVARSLRTPIDSIPEIRTPSTRFPRGHLIQGASPIQRAPVHVALPNNYEVTLYTDKFLPSLINPHQSIAQRSGDIVIIPKGTIVSFEGQTMTLIASAPPHADTDKGYVRILSNQLYTGEKPIRFTSCPGRAPAGTQFKLKAACIDNAECASTLLESLKNDIGIQTGAVIDRRAA